MQKLISVPHPKTLSRENRLVLIPEREYASLLRAQKRNMPEVRLTARERVAVAKGEREMLAGGRMTLDELDYALHGVRRRRSR